MPPPPIAPLPVSVEGIFWHRNYVTSALAFLQLDEGTHAHKDTRLLPFIKSIHSQARHT